MRFFGWTWAELMQIPIFGFWVCYRQMNRIVAQENLRQLRVIAMPNQTDESRQEWVQGQIDAIGDVVVEKRDSIYAPRDPNAIAKLKALTKGM